MFDLDLVELCLFRVAGQVGRDGSGRSVGIPARQPSGHDALEAQLLRESMAVASHRGVDHRRVFPTSGVGRSLDGECESIVDIDVGFIDDFPKKEIVREWEFSRTAMIGARRLTYSPINSSMTSSKVTTPKAPSGLAGFEETNTICD